MTSPQLRAIRGIRHGFGTRLGGISTGPYATWNFGDQDDNARLQHNRRRMVLAMGLSDPRALIEVTQVHGNRVAHAPADRMQEADALVLTQPGMAVAIRTADCAPILIADRQGQAVAAVHAGWRSAVAHVIARAIDALAIAPHRLVAAIGPTIGIDAFEVGPEVIDAATTSLDGEAPKTKPGARGRLHLDLVDLCQRHLIRAGVAAEAIDVVGGSTFTTPALYFSFRRDGARTGRQMSVVAIEPTRTK